MSRPGNTRVLIVAPQLPLVGGQAVQASRLIERFENEEKLDADFQPVNPKFLPRLQKIKYIRTVVTTVRYVLGLLLRIPRYDVIHIFSASYWSFLLAPAPAILISKLFGKKVILNYRSGEAEDHLKSWPRTAIPMIRLADAVVTPSGFLVDVFAKFGLNATAIFNFVETDKFAYRKRSSLRPVFFSNRNFEPLYNVGCILRSFRRIQDSYPGAELVLAGDGSEKESLVALAEELKLENLSFTGYVSAEKMAELYDQADIFLNSPNIDNMPNSIIEAFASGLPVVSTNAGGIPYIVENEITGLLVESGDDGAMARAAIRLLEDDELSERITTNAKKDCEKYDWENVGLKWLELYKSLAKYG